MTFGHRNGQFNWLLVTHTMLELAIPNSFAKVIRFEKNSRRHTLRAFVQKLLVNFLYIQVIKVHKSVGSGRNGCRLISFSKLFSTIFEGLKKNYHYSEKVFSTKRKKIFKGLKKFCQATAKLGNLGIAIPNLKILKMPPKLQNTCMFSFGITSY